MPIEPPDSRVRLEPLLALCGLAGRIAERRRELQRELARGFSEARRQLALRASPTEIEPALPGGMLDALCIAGALGRDTAALDAHYTRSMPALLARQLAAAGALEERLFTAPLSLARMPRLRAALEALFSLVADAELPCASTLGASSPARLLAARPTLGALYAGCHFGRSMPMLYAAPGDLSALRDEGIEAWIDARYTGPLAHELAHLQPLDPALVPAPGNLHEALAAWLGSEAFPEQLWPRPKSPSRDRLHPNDPGGLDALPGGAFFASVGAWLSRTLGPRDALRAQAGALDLHGALGGPCASALRLYGWLPHLETSAPHLLADTFSPARWWKLIDLHRDPALAAAFEEELARPLLEAPPPARGVQLVDRWNRFLDALDWPSLPAWRDPVSSEDEKLALRACRALGVRSIRHAGSFRAERADPPSWPEDARSLDGAPPPGGARSPAAAAAASDPPRSAARGAAARSPRVLGAGPLHLALRSCSLRAAWPDPDAVGAPPAHPVPPSICAAFARAGFDELRATTGGLPSLPATLAPGTEAAFES